MVRHQAKAFNEEVVKLIEDTRRRWLREDFKYQFDVPNEPAPFYHYRHFVRGYAEFESEDFSVKNSAAASQKQIDHHHVFKHALAWQARFANSETVREFEEQVEKMLQSAGLLAALKGPCAAGGVEGRGGALSAESANSKKSVKDLLLKLELTFHLKKIHFLPQKYVKLEDGRILPVLDGPNALLYPRPKPDRSDLPSCVLHKQRFFQPSVAAEAETIEKDFFDALLREGYFANSGSGKRGTG